jgi:uncharacterized membrane protein YhaH (DUF805 family)
MAKAGMTDWFSADGRLNRLDYAIRTIVISVIFGIITVFCLGSFLGVLATTFHFKEVASTQWQFEGEDMEEVAPEDKSAGLNFTASASGYDTSATGEGHFKLETTDDGKRTEKHYELQHTPGAVLPMALMGILSATLMGIASLVSFWIHLVAQIRRFHDIGQTGLLVLLNLIPGASFFLWLFLMVVKGEPGPNQYGPSPFGTTTPE